MARGKSSARKSSPRIRPVILSGGSGTRLWPLSRKLYPKQLLPLFNERSLFQETVTRVTERGNLEPVFVVCNEEHRFMVAEQLQQLGETKSTIILEPIGRNTAPAAALAAIIAERKSPGSLLLILPADHAIADPEAFRTAIERSTSAAVDGALVTFGIRPDRPETGYGYIKKGDALDGRDNVYRVDRFIEKPSAAKAKALLTAGDCYWNSGMFLFRTDIYLDELGRFAPNILAACRRAVDRGRADSDFFRPDADAFANSPADSIDFAVMEHTERAVVVPADMGWSDVGSWSSLWELGDKDADGNVLIGDVMADKVRSSYIRSDDRLTVAIGLEDTVMVVTDDVVLAAKRDHAQHVRHLVAMLKKENRGEAVSHSTVYRPWGHYQSIGAGERFQVKRISVKPGAALSLQKHRHRAEHWVVVRGTGRVTKGKDVFDLEVNQSTFISAGEVHRLANRRDVPLEIIEVQIGDYLGEDDIERLEDVYGREQSKS